MVLLDVLLLPPGLDPTPAGGGHLTCQRVAAVPTPSLPATLIATVDQSRLPKKIWSKRKPDDCKRRRSGSSGQGSQGDAKRKLGPWVAIGICKYHYKYGDAAISCHAPCLQAGN